MSDYSISDSKSSYFSVSVLPWLVCSLAAIFYCYEFFLRVAPSVMQADIMKFYKVNSDDFGVLVSFYGYAYVPMQLVVGLLMDHYGPRKLLCASIAACSVGCLLLSVFHSLLLGQLAMFAIGFGSAFAFVGVLKLAVNWLPPHRLSLVAGITTALGLIGGIFAESVLVEFLDFINWRHAWYYAAFAGILILVITYVFVRDHPKVKLVDVEDVPEASWRDLYQDLLDIIKNSKFIINGLIGCVLYLPISVFAGMWAIPFFEQAAQLSHKTAAYLAPVIFLGMAVGGPLASVLSEYLGRRKIFYQVSLFLSFFIFLIVIYFPTLPIYIVGSLLFILGLLSGSQILVFVVGTELSKKEAAGTAMACTNFLVMISLMLISPIIGNLLEYNWQGEIIDDIHIYGLEGYQFALILFPLCYLVMFGLSFLLPDTHPKAKIRKLAASEQLIEL